MKTVQKRGRKSKFNFVEITDKSFTLNDLKMLNPDIKSPTLTAFVNRQRKTGRYVSLTSKVKTTNGRGKPSNVYKINTDVKSVNNTNSTVMVNKKSEMKLKVSDRLNSNLNTSAFEALVDTIGSEQ